MKCAAPPLPLPSFESDWAGNYRSATSIASDAVFHIVLYGMIERWRQIDHLARVHSTRIVLAHDEFGSKRSKLMNVIDFKVSERDAGGKPGSDFPHPALERFPIQWNRNPALHVCFVAFSRRKPISGRLEITRGERACRRRAHAGSNASLVSEANRPRRELVAR
jgi:hypothetical protein